jgi:hypothetical protein
MTSAVTNGRSTDLVRHSTNGVITNQPVSLAAEIRYEVEQADASMRDAVAHAIRAGDLLVDPATRHLFRSAVELAAAAGGRLDVPAWLETAPPDAHDAIDQYINEQLMAGRFEELGRPAEALLDITARLKRLRIDAELEMIKVEQRRAQERGDDKTVQATKLRAIELIRTKQGLKATPQRS